MTSNEIMESMSVEQLDNMIDLFRTLMAFGRRVDVDNPPPEVSAILKRMTPTDCEMIISLMIAFDAEKERV